VSDNGVASINQQMLFNTIRYFQNKKRMKRKTVAPTRLLKITLTTITGG